MSNIFAPNDEQRVIATILKNKEVGKRILQDLSKDDFSNISCRLLYLAITLAEEKYKIYTNELVYSIITSKKWWIDIGGEDWVNDNILKQVPIKLEEISETLTILKDKKNRRFLLKLKNSLEGAAQNTADPMNATRLESIRTKINENISNFLRSGDLDSDIFPLTGDALYDFYAAAKKRDEQRYYVGTGFKTLDSRLIDGFAPPGYSIVAGATSAGKSTFLQNLAINWGKAGQPCLLFVPEPQNKRTMDRLVSVYSQISLTSTKRAFGREAGSAFEADRELIMEKAKEITSMPIYLEERRGLTLSRMFEIIERTKIEVKDKYPDKELVWGIDLFKDLIDTTVANSVGSAEVSKLVQRLELELERTNTHGLILLHFNKTYANSDRERPELKNIEYSSAYEQKAQNILLISRPIQKDESVEQDDVMNVWIEKQRDGATRFCVKMGFLKETTTIVEIDDFSEKQNENGSFID